MYETILFKVENSVATITINRPEAGNAFARTTYDEIRDAVEKCDKNEDVRVVVITGVGKNFSAGGDIKRFKMLIETKQYMSIEGPLAAGKMTDAIRRCGKPVVAMVNGAAAGAGCSLALACDFRVMTEKSKLIMAFINMGFCGDTGGIFYLNRIIGMARTTELMTLGKPISGKVAFEWGLVTVLADDDELQDATDKLVQELLGKPTEAIRRQKQLYYEFFYKDLAEFNEKEAQYMVECSKTEDHKEAVFAFLEKRKPVFRGK